MDANAAAVYEEQFVPALFLPWAGRVADAAGVGPGQRVLDVACGTGVLTREVAGRVGPTGRVVGLDLSGGMIEVASRTAPGIEWRQGPAEELPFADGSFDAVVCQFGLMFFTDRAAGLREMVRVLTPGGRLAVAVWHGLDHIPGMAALVALLKRLFGDPAADALRAPFSLGDTRELAGLFAAAGVPSPTITTQPGTARFPSVASWIHTNVKGWPPLGRTLDEGQYRTLAAEAERELSPFVTAGGAVEFPMPAHVVTARKG